MNQVTEAQAAEMLRNAGSSFFSVVFRKRTTGEIRNMNCRLKVSKYVTGGGRKYNPTEKNLLGVFETATTAKAAKQKMDEATGQYRMVNLADLISFRLKGEEYIVVK